MPKRGERVDPTVLFWRHVNKEGSVPKHCPHVGECWVWTASFGKKDGYGKFHVAIADCAQGAPQRYVRAHVYSWEIANGSLVPDGMCVMHACDNRLCVRPSHLSVGTQLENLRDCKAKGRNARGEKNCKAKLTEQDVVEIRRRRATGERVAHIAAAYGMAWSSIDYVCRGVSWGHVPGDDK